MYNWFKELLIFPFCKQMIKNNNFYNFDFTNYIYIYIKLLWCINYFNCITELIMWILSLNLTYTLKYNLYKNFGLGISLFVNISLVSWKSERYVWISFSSLKTRVLCIDSCGFLPPSMPTEHVYKGCIRKLQHEVST